MAERKKTKLVVERRADPKPTWVAVTPDTKDPAISGVQPSHADSSKARQWLKATIAAGTVLASEGPFRIVRIVDEITVTVEQTPTVKFS